MANRATVLTPPDTPSPYPGGTTPSEPATAKTAEESTAAELIRLASIIDKIVNSADFPFTSPESQELLTHIAPGFTCQIDCIRHPDEILSWDQLVAAWRQGAEDDPGVKLAWTSVSTTVDEVNVVAQVFLEKEITAVGGLKFHVMEEQRWRREGGEGKWYLVKMIGMRGTPANSGFDVGDVNAMGPGVVEPMRSREPEDEVLRKPESTESKERKQ